MSLVALSMVLVHFAIFGIVEETDEGTAADRTYQTSLTEALVL